MEPLAFVEIVDRHGDVLARHRVYRWPASIGRGYQADVIIDDPFVAPLHAAIEPVGDDRFRVSDCGSLNGLVLATTRQRMQTVDVDADVLIQLGHTHLRIRTPSYGVLPERPLQGDALYRRPAAFIAMAALMIAFFLWNGWVMTIDEDQKYAMGFFVVALIVVAGGWISIWAFASSAIGQRPNFSAHGFVACSGLIVLVASESIFDYISFAFDAGWMSYVAGIFSTAIFAYMIYRHLLLNSRARRKNLGLVGAGLSVIVSGAVAAMTIAIDLSQDGNQRHNDTIKAPAFLLVSGTSTDSFIAEAEALKRKVDAMATRRDGL